MPPSSRIRIPSRSFRHGSQAFPPLFPSAPPHPAHAVSHRHRLSLSLSLSLSPLPSRSDSPDARCAPPLSPSVPLNDATTRSRTYSRKRDREACCCQATPRARFSADFPAEAHAMVRAANLSFRRRARFRQGTHLGPRAAYRARLHVMDSSRISSSSSSSSSSSLSSLSSARGYLRALFRVLWNQRMMQLTCRANGLHHRFQKEELP